MRAFIRSLSALPIKNAGAHPDIMLALFVAAAVAMLIVPLPPMLVDGLLAVNIAASFLILAVALFARSALDVSTFPSLLLITTLFRLALNVSTTRGILAHGDAGEVVKAFGHFVVQGDLIVGLVVFLVIAMVQFLVIAKGSERVAEVSARFTLDAMPGKQMSIDAALRAGSLTEEQAQAKRLELGRESQLFGAMDGAMKFVKGDAIASLVIMVINLVGGLLAGVFRHGMAFGEAAETYSILSVGDALVSQIPALLITLGSGILVTRVDAENKKSNLGLNLKNELFSNWKVLAVGSALSTAIAFVPGLPALPFLMIAAGLAAASSAQTLGRKLFPSSAERSSKESALSQAKEQLAERVQQAKAQKSLSDQMAPSVLPIAIDLDAELSRILGFGEGKDGDTELLGSLIPQLRDALYTETGVRFPGVRVRCMVPGLSKGTFVIRLKDVPIAQETISLTEHLALETPEKLRRLGVQGRLARHPLSGAPVAWVAPASAPILEASGVSVWGTAGIVSLFLARVLRKNAKTFLGLQEVGELVERLEKAYPTLVREVVPKIVSLAQLLDVLRRLVDEGISIRDLKSIVEALGEHAQAETDALVLTEVVRAALSLQIAHAYAGCGNPLSALLLDPIIEDTIRSAVQPVRGGVCLVLEPEICRSIIHTIARSLQPTIAAGTRPVIVTTAEIRRFVRKLLENELPSVAVLSFEELPAEMHVRPVGRAMLRELHAA